MPAITRRLTKPLLVAVRSYAAKAKGNAVVEEIVDLSQVVPTNILKDGAHPVLREKSEYPQWLFTLLDPKLTLGELERTGFDNIAEEKEQHRYIKLLNRRALKASNAEKAKK